MTFYFYLFFVAVENVVENVVQGKRAHSPATDPRLYCYYCEDYFRSIGARLQHERFCASKNFPSISRRDSFSSTFNKNPRASVASSKERALRFVRKFKNN